MSSAKFDGAQHDSSHPALQLVKATRLDVAPVVLVEFAQLVVDVHWAFHVFLDRESHVAL